MPKPVAASLTVVNGVESTRMVVGNTFPYTERVLYYARISPVVMKGSEVIEYLHFSGCKLLANKLDFDGPFLKLLPGTAYTLTLKDSSDMVPTPNFLNRKVASTATVCRIQLFRRIGNQAPIFIANFGCFWSDAPDTFIKYLKKQNLEFQNIRVGLVKNANQFPDEFLLLDEFFSDKSNGREIMVLCCELDNAKCQGYKVSTHQLPKVPRILAVLASDLLNNPQYDASKKKHLRRILVVSANSGVMIDLLDEVELQIDAAHVLKSTDFKRIDLNWEIASKLRLRNKLFLLPKEGFKNLLASSNEATLGGMFWTGALNAALLPGIKSGCLRLMQEWNTDTLLPKFPRRRLDYVVALHCFPPDVPSTGKGFYPLAFGEYSQETVLLGNVHKDYGKSGCLASAFCLCLAYKLISVGLKPELARCYGMLIGGTGARLMIAYPVIREVGGGQCEIEIHIRFSRTWEVNLVGERGTRRDIVEEHPRESFLPADSNSVDWDLIRFESLSNAMRDVPVQIDAADEEEEAGAAGSSTTAQNDTTFEAGVSDSGLSQIKFIGQLILDRAALISSRNSETIDDLNRRFKPAPRYGFLPSGRLDSITETPLKNQPIVSNLEIDRLNSATPLGQFSVRKQSNAIEESVFRDAGALIPGFLPRIYDVKELDESGLVEYSMEFLQPFATESAGLHSFFNLTGAESVLYQVTKFLLDCFYQLYLVHEHLNMVHGNVAPLTVMYSKADGIWKFVDYSHAMSKDESERTIRTAGTLDFIAPEAVETGVFTAASDVWSLGEMAFNWLMPSLTMEVYCEADDEQQRGGNVDDWLQKSCDAVVHCITKMVSGHPSDRPTVIEAIKLFYSIACRFKTGQDVPDLVMEGARNLIRSVQLKARASEVISMPAVAVPGASISIASKRQFEKLPHEKDPLEVEP